ncbi:hypothetical protein [uncultured Dokdonia sp.]|uniref:hypothetical protein n=1 Tax=uncultured Dokdonia sp. TaxID=575653 RepID=UPI002621D7AC|nr:hypothetical protein [uncultured Dokdonia sp.]
MQKIIHTLFLFLIYTNVTIAQENNCVRKVTFGDTDICLPTIEGYKECYTYPTVKQSADATEVPINMVLGFYLDEETYAKKDNIGSISFDNYFKIYATKQIKDLKADTDILKRMQGMISASFLTENWDEFKKQLDTVDYEGEIGVPTIVKSYNANDQSFTALLILKQKLDTGETNVLSFAMNGLLLQERLIWMAYYLDYEGEASIQKLQENNDRILAQFFD